MAIRMLRLAWGAVLRPGLLRLVADNWWLLLLRGAFRVLAFFWPGLTLIILIWLWGDYALSDGPIVLSSAFNASGGDAGPRWWRGLSGVVSIIVGVVAFSYILTVRPGAGALLVGCTTAWYAIFLGCL
jgi:uncharacterized membrane protein HdeD (DUF308 family)